MTPSWVRGWRTVTGLSRRWLAAALAGCAVYAGCVWLFAGNTLHQRWGAMAFFGYLAGAVLVAAWRSSRAVDVALAAVGCGAVLVPLCWLAWHGLGQPEVGVVTESARTLIHHGTPYRAKKALAHATNPNLYNPYLPLMSAFGLLQASAGHPMSGLLAVLADPRWWFGIVFVMVFGWALYLGGAADWKRWSVLVTASPVVALELCVGGTDVPMVAFLCLGFALAWQRPGERRGAGLTTGLALGIAASMKATAWPAVAVLTVMLAVRDGRRAAGRFLAATVAVMIAAVLPFIITSHGSLFTNTILFPLGLASVKSAATSPLPGHLLAQTGPAGHAAVVALLLLSGAGVAAWVVLRPPRDVPAALNRLVTGLSLMFVLAPSTRFGYFIYPGTLVLWLVITLAGRESALEQAGEQDRDHAGQEDAVEGTGPADRG